MNGPARFAVTCCIVLWFAGCSTSPKVYDVKYEVSTADASGIVDILYQSKDFTQEWATGVQAPWVYEFPAEEGSSVYVMAQNRDTTGSLQIWIRRDGYELRYADCTGGFCWAVASGGL